jgi:hypothetical protein
MVYPPANGNPGIIPPWLTPSEPIRPCLTPPSLECDPDPIQTPPPYEAYIQATVETRGRAAHPYVYLDRTLAQDRS